MDDISPTILRAVGIFHLAAAWLIERKEHFDANHKNWTDRKTFREFLVSEGGFKFSLFPGVTGMLFLREPERTEIIARLHMMLDTWCETQYNFKPTEVVSTRDNILVCFDQPSERSPWF